MIEKFILKNFSDIAQFSFIYGSFVVVWSQFSHNVYVFLNSNYDFCGKMLGPYFWSDWQNFQNNVNFKNFEEIFLNERIPILTQEF